MRRLLLAPVIALVLPSPASAATNPWLAERVLNIAHQGGEDEFPSKTLYAFKRSVKAGANMLDGAYWFHPGDDAYRHGLRKSAYQVGDQTLSVTNADNVARAHAAGYAWHTWLSDDGESPATWKQLIDWCVDGVMTAQPVAFEQVLHAHPAPAVCG